MDPKEKDAFSALWRKHFDGAELPVVFYYTNDEEAGDAAASGGTARCVVANLGRVRRGETVRFSAKAVGCPGGKRYLGYATELMPGFEYFLSCGIPGRMEGERYKKSPELVREIMSRTPKFEAPAKSVVFKRWDRLAEGETPDVVIFFAGADVLSGLFTLASFDTADEMGVIAPFSAGCGSIVLHPYLEGKSAAPRSVLGMFDPSARPYVGPGELTFAVPFARFVKMAANMDESFLTTPTWETIRRRIESKTP